MVDNFLIRWKSFEIQFISDSIGKEAVKFVQEEVEVQSARAW